jgi:hypothetical protein
MSFYEELIATFFQEVLYKAIKFIGTVIKWIFYLGKRPISQIRKENWNTRVGFAVFILLILFIVYLIN